MVGAEEGIAEPSDVALVVALTRRHPDALAEIYKRHGDQVYGLARQLRGAARAEEAVKQAFLELWQRPQRYDPDRGSLRAFLLSALLSDLPDGQREAIVLASLDGYTYRDVAGLLGQSEGTIKTRIRTGLDSLGHSARLGLSPQPEQSAGVVTETSLPLAGG